VDGGLGRRGGAEADEEEVKDDARLRRKTTRAEVTGHAIGG
jgi:hypothetical protein